MLQKIINVGNSYAFTIPSFFVKGAGLSVGDQMDLEVDTEAGRMTISKAASKKVETQEVKEWLSDFNNKYKKGLTELAKR